MIITSKDMNIKDENLNTLIETLAQIFQSSRNKKSNLETKEYLLHILSDYGQELLENGEKTLGREFIEFAADSNYYK